VADALAKYVDSCLKDNKRQPSLHTTATGADSDNWAEAIIHGIFCFLQAKDIFEGFYKKDLAKRLLGNRVISMDVERHFVSLLKAECGAGYTSKMEGMFQDMDWSRETTNMYKDSLYKEAGSTSETLEMDIQVLTTGYWPVYPQYPNLILPPEMKVPQDHFTEYYKSKFQGRRMTWQYAIGQMVVRFKPQESGPKYDLLVSPTQALVLMQFNGNDEMTLPQVMAAVGLEDRADTELILLGLSLGKDGTRVLQKCDYDADKKKKTRPTVHDEDKFRVQDAFKSNARRIKINNILMKETKEEREKTVEAVSRDRLYYIDAVLVRIMKARKTVLHRDLIPQVLEQIKFPAQPADVKKRIEVLIEREYMERDSVDRNRYTYLA
jgi:cullin-4